MIANGVRDDNLKEVCTVRHEFDLIGSSLFLSFSVTPLLTPPESCAEGRSCPNLLAADLLLWSFLVSCLLAAVVFTWTGAVLESFVSRPSFPRWLQDHYTWFCSPSVFFITGLSLMPPAFGLRLIILLDGHPAYPPCSTRGSNLHPFCTSLRPNTASTRRRHDTDWQLTGWPSPLTSPVSWVCSTLQVGFVGGSWPLDRRNGPRVGVLLRHLLPHPRHDLLPVLGRRRLPRPNRRATAPEAPERATAEGGHGVL
jgi:hypothetical protein